MRTVKLLVPALVFSALFSSLSFAAQSDRIEGALTGGPAIELKGSMHHKALPQYDRGPVDPAMQMGRMVLSTPPTAAQQKAIKLLLEQQQDRKSPNYHKWLTPAQYAQRFGLSQNDANKIAAWLQAKGFTNVEISGGRNWFFFDGTAGQVEAAFGTEIHHYDVNGEMHYGNASAAKVPASLAGIAGGITGLHDFRAKPRSVHSARAYYYDASFQEQFMAPGDLAAIYDLQPLYTAGFDGTGQTLAVMGQTDIYLSDITDFRTGFGLSNITCTTNTSGVITACADPHFSYVLDGIDPGVSANGDLSEADLDLEWSGAAAPGAQIIYVNSTDTFTSFLYAISANTAPVISLSYGLCELGDNSLQTVHEPALMQANLQGITFVNSSGDSGAAECDDFASLNSSGQATFGLGVSYPASSPEVTGVGGSAISLADFGSTYWGQTNGTSGGTALGYVPELAWNDNDEFVTFCQQNPGSFCSNGNGSTNVLGGTWVPITSEATAQLDIGISSTGGGVSNCAVQSAGVCVSGFAQPSWQTVTVSGQASARYSPDVAFLATPNFPGYIYCTSGTCANGIQYAVETNFSLIGGTSVSAPIFAGMVAILNQYTGKTQGNINTSLYSLAAVAPTAFHDISGQDNKVACAPGTLAGQPTADQCPSTAVLGFSSTAGFDLATGLGSVDLNNLAAALKAPPDFAASLSTNSLTLFAGQSGTATVTVTPTNNFTGSVSFACSGLPSGDTCSFSPTTVTPSGAPVTTTATIQTGGSGGTGTVAITANTGVLTQASRSAGSIALTVSSAITLAPTATSFTISQGATATPTVNVTLNNGFTGTLTFTCSDPAPESICTPPPQTNVSGQVSFQITTTAPTTGSLRHPNHSASTFYAVLLPGLMGIVFLGKPRRRAMRGMRMLGFVLVLGFSTMWLASCGGSSSNNTIGNQGTTKGTYTITVNATSGSVSATPTTFQLIVQ